MKRILIGTMAVMMTVPCFAAGENVLTSKPYVDDAVSTRQDKIPAANPSNTNLGETVMTYTPNGNGEIGERELFTGGPYDATNDADKLITASALKSAFTLPETQTTKLVCANPGTCDLWTITNQTAYGISGNGTTTIDLMSLIGNVAGTGYTSNDESGNDNDTVGMSNSIISGDPLAFAVDYGDKGMIKGHGRCSSQEGDHNNYTWTNPTIIPTLSPDSSGKYCYCTLDSYTPLNESMTTLSAPWVFNFDVDDASYCASSCASECAAGLWGVDAYDLPFRAAVFNSVQ
jgi:hypothetical protein